jgi:predicted SprT family Zn-dependent metalloprotease
MPQPPEQPTRSTYRELQHAYDTFNAQVFGGTLPPCLLTLQREKRTYGYFSSNRFGHRDGHTTDEIALNPEYFAVLPLVEVLQTIAHEMTHLWQAHFGKPGRGRYHNDEWATKMEAIGLMPSHSGMPGGRRVGDCMADYALPGGRFLKAVEALVATDGFQISWYDRFAQPQGLYPPVAAATAAELPAAALRPLAQPDANSPAAPLLERPNPLDRSNRVKYQCPACRLNVWGKRGLSLKCNACAVDVAPV